MLAGFVLGYLLGLGTLAVAVLAGKALAAAGKGYRLPEPAYKAIARNATHTHDGIGAADFTGRMNVPESVAPLRGYTKPNGEDRP